MILRAASTRTARIALIVFSAIGLMMLVLIGRFALPQNPLSTQLDCDRGSGECVFEQVFRDETRRWPFRVDELHRATVVRTRGMHGGGRSSVYFDAGTEHFFYASFALPEGAEKAAASIDIFINNPAQQSLAIAQDDAIANGFARTLLALSALTIVGASVFAWGKMRD